MFWIYVAIALLIVYWVTPEEKKPTVKVKKKRVILEWELLLVISAFLLQKPI